MFQTIREYFSAKFRTNKMHMSKAITVPSFINVGIDNYPFKQYLPEDGYLTQAEQQLLKRILSHEVQVHEFIRKDYLDNAKLSKAQGDFEMSKHWFKYHRKQKVYLKTLVNLQKKIKHTLHTRG